jgi:quinol monooxygenase YgiN
VSFSVRKGRMIRLATAGVLLTRAEHYCPRLEGASRHNDVAAQRGGVAVAIKAITEFTIQSGRRDEFVSLFESLVAQNMSTVRDAGCSGTTLWPVVDDPDKAVEIADWESGQARDAAMQSGAFGVFAPMFELLAGPVSATVVEPSH